MNYIVKKLKEKYLDHIDTTKDLIYKKKTIDAHAISDSYAKNAKQSVDDGNRYWFEMPDLIYNGKPLYTNPTITSDKMTSLFTTYKHFTEYISSVDESPEHWITNEIQNSLWIEGVKSSKKKIKQIIKEGIVDADDAHNKFIKNYKLAVEYILTTEEINEANVFTLYNIISKDIDMKENKLDGFPYRQGEVEIGSPDVLGSKPEKLKEEMDSIYEYILKVVGSEKKADHIASPIIIHYIFEIIHPFYDMNGRVGRLLSLWVARKVGSLYILKYISESINKFKHELYYKAFKMSSEKGFKNDPTYFIASVMSAVIANNITFMVSEQIKIDIENKYGKTLSPLEMTIIQGIISKDNSKFHLKEKFILGVNDINPGQLSTAFKRLVNFKVIKELNTKPKKYSFNWTSKYKKQVDELIDITKTNKST